MISFFAFFSGVWPVSSSYCLSVCLSLSLLFFAGAVSDTAVFVCQIGVFVSLKISLLCFHTPLFLSVYRSV